ncbi:MAG: hypothetical protein QT11_C0001G0283 [archaeon GW2011_AR20]|nr:MAG: hypothetical protein QT11_C0001G0283 [archaeon GW2011_AR20]AQS28452.1 hypothetical protein [uncultured archaeon]MBS3160291.1 hypothetical protein [Candidatus Woesearchaeota archaeon]
MAKQKISFYDVKTKKKFETENYKIVDKSGRKFAVSKSPAGTHECWRVVSKEFADKNK